MANTAKLEIKKTTFNFSTPDTLYAFDKDPDSSYFKVSKNKMSKDEENTLVLDKNTKLYSDTDLFQYLETKFADDYAIDKSKILTLNQVYAYWFYNNYERTGTVSSVDGTPLYEYTRKNVRATIVNTYGAGLKELLQIMAKDYPNKIVTPPSQWSLSGAETDKEYFNYLFRYNQVNDEDYTEDNYEPIGYNNITYDFLPNTDVYTSSFFQTYKSMYRDENDFDIKVPQSSYKGQLMYYWTRIWGKIFVINTNDIIQDLSNMKNKCYFDNNAIIICNSSLSSQLKTQSKIIAEDRLYKFLNETHNSKSEAYKINIFDDSINLYIEKGAQLKKLFFNNFYISHNQTIVSYAETFKYVTSVGEHQFKYDFSDVNVFSKKPEFLKMQFYYKNYNIGYTNYIPCVFSINDLGDNILTINHSDDVSTPVNENVQWYSFFSGGMLQEKNESYIDRADGSDEGNQSIHNNFGAKNLKRADLYCNYLQSNDVGTLFHCQSQNDLIKHGIVSFTQQAFGGVGTLYYAGYIKLKNSSLYTHTDAQYCNIVMRNELDYQMKIDFYNKVDSDYIYTFSSNLIPINFKTPQTITLINNIDDTELSVEEDNIYNCVTIPKIRIQLSQKNNLSYGQYYLYKIINGQKKLIKVQDINFYENLNDDINLFYYNELENNNFENKKYILQVVAISVDKEEIKSPEYTIKIANDGIENVLKRNKNSISLIKNETQLSLTNFSEDIALFDIIGEKEKSINESYENLKISSSFTAPVSINFKLNKQEIYNIVKNFDYSSNQYCRLKLGSFTINSQNYLLFWDLKYDINTIRGMLSLSVEGKQIIFTDDSNCSVILENQIQENENFYITLYYQNSQYYLGIAKNCFEINNEDLSKPDFFLTNNEFYAGRPIYFSNGESADNELEIFKKDGELEFFDNVVQEVFSVEYTKNVSSSFGKNLITYYFVKDQNINYKYTFSFPQLLKNEAITVEINNIKEYTGFLLDICTTLDYEFVIYKDKLVIKKDDAIIEQFIYTNIVAEWQPIQNNFTLSFYSHENTIGTFFTDGNLCCDIDHYIFEHQLKITKIIGYSDIIKNIYFNDSRQGLFIQSFTNIETLPDTNTPLNKKEFLLQVQDKNNIKQNRISNIYIEDYFIDYSKNKPTSSIKSYTIAKNFIKNLSTIIVPGHGYNFYVRNCEDENFEFQRTNLFYSIEPDPNYVGEYIRVIFLNEPKNTYSNYSLEDEFAFKCNIEQGALTQNFEKTALNNYSKYPKFSIGNKNYFTGSINCLLGDVKYREGETTEITEYRQSIDLPYAYYEEMDVYNKWLENIASGKPALIIDQKGRTFVSQITDNSINMFTSYGPKPSGISFSFTECDDFANIKILEVS